MKTVGERLKAIREEKNLSQMQLSRKCDWGDSGQVRICGYENSSKQVSAENALTLAKALDISPSELMFGVTPPSGEAIDDIIDIAVFFAQAIYSAGIKMSEKKQKQVIRLLCDDYFDDDSKPSERKVVRLASAFVA